jgi:transcriptional regulator with XRE-family HTH domain
MLKNILSSKIDEKRLSVRAAADQIGTSHTTIHRILSGGSTDIPTIMKIADWAGVKPYELLGLNDGGDVNALVESIPGLKEILTQAAELVKAGKLESSALADITAYIQFRIRENTHEGREQAGIKVSTPG